MNYRRALLALLLSSTLRPACAQITPPRVGAVRYADGGVYTVLGVPGNYLLGPRVFEGVEAFSFSGGGGLLLRRGMLTLIDSSLSPVSNFSAGKTKAVLGIGDQPRTAVAWLPEKRLLVYWTGSAFASTSVADGIIPGEVIAVARRKPDVIALTVRTDSAVVEEALVSLKTGDLLTRTLVPAMNADSYRAADLVVSLKAGVLVTTSLTTGTFTSAPIRAKDLSFERASASIVHLHSVSSGGDWLLHFAAEGNSLFELPVPPAEKTIAGSAQ